MTGTTLLPHPWTTTSTVKKHCAQGPPGGPASGKGKATPSSTLAWRIPWTEEPGGLQSMGLQRVQHD